MQYLKCTMSFWLFCFYPSTHTHGFKTNWTERFISMSFWSLLFSWTEVNEGKMHWTMHHKQMCIFCIFLHLFGWFWCWFHRKHWLILLNALVGMSDSIVAVRSGSLMWTEHQIFFKWADTNSSFLHMNASLLVWTVRFISLPLPIKLRRIRTMNRFILKDGGTFLSLITLPWLYSSHRRCRDAELGPALQLEGVWCINVHKDDSWIL